MSTWACKGCGAEPDAMGTVRVHRPGCSEAPPVPTNAEALVLAYARLADQAKLVPEMVALLRSVAQGTAAGGCPGCGQHKDPLGAPDHAAWCPVAKLLAKVDAPPAPVPPATVFDPETAGRQMGAALARAARGHADRLAHDVLAPPPHVQAVYDLTVYPPVRSRHTPKPGDAIEITAFGPWVPAKVVRVSAESLHVSTSATGYRDPCSVRLDGDMWRWPTAAPAPGYHPEGDDPE